MAMVYKFAISGSMASIPDDQVYAIDATAAARTRTLPDATTCRGARICVIKSDASANAVTVSAATGQTILDTAGASLTKDLAAQGNYITVVSDGAGWLVIGKG